MKKTIFLFSGQGSQYPGMGEELIPLAPHAGEIFAAAQDILGFDVQKACLSGTEEELAETQVSQPCIMTVSLLALDAVRSRGVSCIGVAGHSLGEYAAMVAAGMLTLEDGFRVIKARAAAMQRCAKAHPGAMYAIIGSDADTIAKVCEETEGYVLAVNYNSPQQTAIAGETSAAAKAAETLAGMGARAVQLKVSAAFHSRLMQPAADEFVTAIKGIPFEAAKTPFYTNLTGEKMTDFTDLPAYLGRHLVSPVQFVQELQNMANDGAACYLELGPGKVLTGLVKRTLKGCEALNVENQKSFDKAMQALAE